ncbi:hypothetical protein M5689_000744 [Euphorbia peplus]|nr:hypothetical protein M5689_000744 [Euphorbia peplus]
MAKEMMRNHYRIGEGLGTKHQGMIDCVAPWINLYREGLGYQATKYDKRKIYQQRREKRLARLENREVREEDMEFPHIRDIFISNGRFVLDDGAMMVFMVESDEEEPGENDWISVQVEELRNWKIYDLPIEN